MGRHVGRAAGEIDIYPSRILFSGILKAKISADLFNARFNLLNVVHGMVSFADDPTCNFMSVSTQPNGSGVLAQQHTHEDGLVHAVWHI